MDLNNSIITREIRRIKIKDTETVTKIESDHQPLVVQLEERGGSEEEKMVIVYVERVTLCVKFRENLRNGKKAES